MKCRSGIYDSSVISSDGWVWPFDTSANYGNKYETHFSSHQLQLILVIIHFLSGSKYSPT